MIRTIIQIDEDACNGCGLCVSACHEGAIGLVGGKARLLRDDFCDGLGDCLPACPTGAISFVEREAAAYDEEAVRAAQKAAAPAAASTVASAVPAPAAPAGGCPGSLSRFFGHGGEGASGRGDDESADEGRSPSRLAQWPVEIKLVPARAPYFEGADILVAADCTAFAYADFHRDFMRGKVTLIGCPKLDGVDYADKLTDILSSNNVASVMVAHMEIPCCGGIERAVRTAVERSGKDVPVEVAVISTRGELLARR